MKSVCHSSSVDTATGYGRRLHDHAHKQYEDKSEGWHQLGDGSICLLFVDMDKSRDQLTSAFFTKIHRDNAGLIESLVGPEEILTEDIIIAHLRDALLHTPICCSIISCSPIHCFHYYSFIYNIL